MANKKISELPYINGGEISGNTLIPLVTYFSAATGDTVHTFVDDFQTYLISGLTGNTDVFVTGGTYSAGTITFTNNTGGTFNVTGVTFSGGSSVIGDYLPLSGGTVTGSTQFTVGLSASTISATTYQNLPTDIRVTGGTYSAGTITFTNNTGGTFNVTGLTTGSTSTLTGEYLPLSGGTVSGSTIFTNGLSANTISATTYQNLPDNVTGNYLPLSGGTVTGQTFFTSGVTITGDTFINDTFGITALDTSTRGLVDSNSQVSIDWENRQLIDLIGFSSVDWTARQGFDETGVGAIEWTSTKRNLIDSGSTVSIDWNLRFAYDEAGSDAISWSTSKRKLIDSNTTDSIDWENRILVKSDGTPIFDWENGILTGQTNIESSTISATTYQNLPDNVTGNYLPLSGGTVSGTTYFTQGVSGSTVSATTFNFNTGYTGSTLVGQMNWDQDFGVPHVGMFGGNVVQKVGESVYAYVKNVDSTTLNKGEVVYAFGASGDKMSVKRASNTGDTTSAKTLGIVAESIAVNGLGYVITQGTIDGLNLGSYTDGDLVWLSSVPGQFTKTKQYAPYHLVFVGVVQRANAGNGQLYVKPQNGYELEEIHDVIATGATYGDILVYSAYGSNDVWVSTKTLNGSYTITGNTTIGGDLVVSGNSGINWFSSNTSSDLVRITQTGSGNAFVIEDSTNPDSSPFVIDTSGNTGIGVTVPDSKLHISNTGTSPTSVSLKLIGTGTSEQFLFYRDGSYLINSTTSGSTNTINNGTLLRTFVNSLGFQFLDASGYGFHHTTSFGGLNVGNTNGYLYLWSQASDTLRLFLGGQDRNPTVARTRTVINPVASSSTLFRPTGGTAIDYSFQNAGQSVFSPTGGTASYTQIELKPSYSGTGSYSGTVTGLLYNPNLLSMSGTTHRAIQTTTGDVLFGSTSGNVGIGTTTPRQRLDVNGNAIISSGLTAQTGVFSSSSQNVLTVIGSGNSTTSPLFSVQGSSGELFSVSDSLVGSLFSVNDISGLPIMEVFSDNTTLWGSYQAPSLNTTTRTSLTAGTNTIYSIPTSAYTGAFYEYTLISSGATGARAGQIMSIWSGTTANFTETSTTDIGTTTGVTFTVAVSGNNAVLSSSATTAGWTVKTIIRSI